MTTDEINTKADELIQCLGIWGMSTDDALAIAWAMVKSLRVEKSLGHDTIPNPLAGLTNVGGSMIAPGLPGGISYGEEQ